MWAIAPGLPSPHIARAALHAASVLDRSGSRVSDARESYWHRATGGLFPEADLRRGEALLVDCGLVEERDGILTPTDELHELLNGTVDDALEVVTARTLTQAAPAWLAGTTPDEVPQGLQALVTDPTRREELLLALGRRFDDTRQQILGEIGEELVVAEARRELEELGYADLARAVRRVSLESDQLGYDVSAPRISGPRRLLEIKATTVIPTGVRGVHLSRNEADVGARYPDDWALVVCQIANADNASGEVVGWCPRAALNNLLPEDAPSGRWEQAWVEIPVGAFTPGLPRAHSS
ncbi:MAG: protein NO VEIN domain-containing protein [Gaiellaceae bacterium]